MAQPTTNSNNLDIGFSETAKHEGTTDRPMEFELLGLRWDLLPDVFAPFHSPSTEAYSRWLPYPEGSSLLEMGCGAGVTAVFGALNGCRHVTALDISPAAVENARHNAARHGVVDRVRAMESDMFSALSPADRFDVIFWNSNAVEAPEDFAYTRDIEWSILDRGYVSHRTYFREGPQHLAEGGRLFLGFNSRGNRTLIERFAKEEGLRIKEINSASRVFEDRTVEFRLLELIKADSANTVSTA
ncbi:methyltransferase domain-containing protein [Streptomyces sp. NPDC004647]|uniref:methyltransferase domain-containing protein n=1 Tax=Streptomyces sp. NPDC004647 TaxID=3154671 RepID=UPI0033A17E75